MTLSLLAGSAHPRLARAIAGILGVEPTTSELERFPDGELQVNVGALHDGDVYIVQPTGPPVNDHMVELLLLIDACRRESAGRISVVQSSVFETAWERHDFRTDTSRDRSP
jgi:ribose-phosphate pyrophosphokinase